MKFLHTYHKLQSRFKFLFFLILFALSMALTIYWREGDVRDQISFLQVVCWQIGIWILWWPGYLVFEKVIITSGRPGGVALGLGFLWVGMHYGWFFFLSSQFSPYLGFPATRYGVYPYFFIFWTLVDMVLIWYLLNFLKRQKQKIIESRPVIFELSRGDRTFYCHPEQIYWLSAEDYYTRFHTEQGAFLIRKSLTEILRELPQDDFKRIHRSTVIHIKYVSGLGKTKNGGLEVILKDGSTRKVSRSHLKEIKTLLKGRSV